LHPRWIEPVMFLYDNSLDEINKNMDGFHAGSNFAAAAAANPCRNLMAHPAPLAAPSAAAYTSSEAPAAGMAEPAVKQCSPCSAAVQSSSGAALPYGYFGSSYYPCRMTHHNAIKSCAQPASTFADKYMDTSVSGEEFTSR
ncbi:HXA13 protein, partial [Cettia cetti]|nr:HXA13 protein [Cettia cetti]